MRITAIVLLLLAIVTGIGSFGEFDNRAQRGGAELFAIIAGVVGIVLLLLSFHRRSNK